MPKYSASEKSMASVGFMLTGIVIIALLVLAYSYVEKRHFFNDDLRAEACREHLAMIYQGKLDYGRDFEFEKGSPVSADAIVDYLETGIEATTCPGGGEYTLGNIGDMPTCSVLEHNAQ